MVAQGARTTRLAELDPANAAYYEARGADFLARWKQADGTLEAAEAAPLKGIQVVVIHSDQRYLCRWLGLRPAGGDRAQARRAAEQRAISPDPGEANSQRRQAPGDPAQRLQRSQGRRVAVAEDRCTGRAAAILGRGHARSKDIFGLFDDTLNRLLAANK